MRILSTTADIMLRVRRQFIASNAGVAARVAQAQWHARLHATMAAFAAEPSWRTKHLPRLGASEQALIGELASEMHLHVSVDPEDEGVLTLRKPATSEVAKGNAVLLQACDLFGSRPLASLLAVVATLEAVFPP